jgi:hypothetical protein
VPATSVAVRRPVAAAALAALFVMGGNDQPDRGRKHTALRQAAVPDRLQTACHGDRARVMWTCITLGALTGGGLADCIGFRPTVAIAGLLTLVGFLWLLLSPLRGLQRPRASSARVSTSASGETLLVQCQ